MSTSPVTSVTDELIAELELCARSKTHHDDASVMVTYGELRAILAERAELKRDAERWRAVESAGGEITLRLHNTRPRNRAHVIDAAMQS